MVYQFWVPFLILFASVAICEGKWCMLRDLSAARPQPYSWSKVQLAWWSIILLSAFIAILWKSQLTPTFHESAVIMLGISSMTTAAARMIDVSDKTTADLIRHQDDKGETFFLDILSDHNGISISRFQTVVFNLVFGIWFIGELLHKLPGIVIGSEQKVVDAVIPPITTNNLVLLGLSSATYAALKLTENKEKKAEQKAEDAEDLLVEEPLDAVEPAVG